MERIQYEIMAIISVAIILFCLPLITGYCFFDVQCQMVGFSDCSFSFSGKDAIGTCLKYNQEYPFSIKEEWKTCINDEDCQLVNLDCCFGCGSSNFTLNKIGKEEIEKWEEVYCKNVVCPLYSCLLSFKEPEPICSNGKCSSKYVLDRRTFCSYFCNSFECFPYTSERIETQEKYFTSQLEELNTTIEESKNYCDCAEFCEPNATRGDPEFGWITVFEAGCEILKEKNCSVPTSSILIKNFDTNRNGKLNLFPSYDEGDTLFEFCRNYQNFKIDTEVICKRSCGCP